MAIVITSFNAGAGTINLGASTTLTPVFTGGTGLILPGLIPVTSGTVVTVTPPATMDYTLVVTDTIGGREQLATTITITTPTERTLAEDGGGGVILGKNNYWVNSKPVYHIWVNPNPFSMTDHLAQTNEEAIEYAISVNDGYSFQIIGITDLNLFLAQFGLIWS